MVFLLTVLLIWGCMHAYAWTRVVAYGRIPRRRAGALALVLLVLMVMPVVGIVLGRSGLASLSLVIESVGMLWTGAFFLFFSLSLLHDMWNVLVLAGSVAVRPLRKALLRGRRAVLVEVAIVAVLSVYGMIDANVIRTEQITLEAVSLDRPRVRIVYISDIHLGHVVRAGRLSRIVRAVEAARPDVLICGGDLVDTDMAGLQHLSGLLAPVDAPLGKYAVTGNHEYYAGLDQAIEFTRACGFRVLSAEVVRICPGLTLAGVDDETAHRPPFRWREPADDSEVLGRATEGDFVVLVKHRPLVRRESVPRFDLQLSGHTHRGQIFPFTLAVVAAYEYAHGLTKIKQSTMLYTSRETKT